MGHTIPDRLRHIFPFQISFTDSAVTLHNQLHHGVSPVRPRRGSVHTECSYQGINISMPLCGCPVERVVTVAGQGSQFLGRIRAFLVQIKAIHQRGDGTTEAGCKLGRALLGYGMFTGFIL